jgi:hypothetical protein
MLQIADFPEFTKWNHKLALYSRSGRIASVFTSSLPKPVPEQFGMKTEIISDMRTRTDGNERQSEWQNSQTRQVEGIEPSLEVIETQRAFVIYQQEFTTPLSNSL